METIELKDVMNQLPVADVVRNLAGVDKNGVPSQFTMENIAAVVGGKLNIGQFYYRIIIVESSIRNPIEIIKKAIAKIPNLCTFSCIVSHFEGASFFYGYKRNNGEGHLSIRNYNSAIHWNKNYFISNTSITETT